MKVNFLPKFLPEKSIMLFVPQLNDKLNNYRDIIKLIQTENLLNQGRI